VAVPYQQDALPRHPAYGQHRPALDAVVVAAVQVSAHAEVGDLYRVVLAHQAVPRGQVPMDKVQGGEVLHPRGDLRRHVAQTAEAGEQRRETGCQKNNPKKTRSRPQGHDLPPPSPPPPDGRRVAEPGQLPLGLVAGQELVEVTVLHVLRDHAQRVAVDAHGQQADDVRVLQTRHDLYLLQEVVPTGGERNIRITFIHSGEDIYIYF